LACKVELKKREGVVEVVEVTIEVAKVAGRGKAVGGKPKDGVEEGVVESVGKTKGGVEVDGTIGVVVDVPGKPKKAAEVLERVVVKTKGAVEVGGMIGTTGEGVPTGLARKPKDGVVVVVDVVEGGVTKPKGGVKVDAVNGTVGATEEELDVEVLKDWTLKPFSLIALNTEPAVLNKL